MVKVLFVCVANINRSQIAEAIFNKLSKKNHAVSAGINARAGDFLLKEANNNPVIPMKEEGYDISKAKIKKVSKRIVNSADKVVLIFNKKKHQKEIPDYLQKCKGLEFWEVDSISNETPFEKYCKLEKSRIRKIENYVKELVRRIG